MPVISPTVLTRARDRDRAGTARSPCSPCTSIAGLKEPMLADARAPPTPSTTAIVGSTCWAMSIVFSVVNASSSVTRRRRRRGRRGGRPSSPGVLGRVALASRRHRVDGHRRSSVLVLSLPDMSALGRARPSAARPSGPISGRIVDRLDRRARVPALGDGQRAARTRRRRDRSPPADSALASHVTIGAIQRGDICSLVSSSSWPMPRFSVMRVSAAGAMALTVTP